MKIPKIKKKDQEEKNAIVNANKNQNMQNKNKEEKINFKNFKKFPFQEFGFELYYSEHQRVFIAFLDSQIYDFDFLTMRELNKKITDLLFNFYMEEKTKIAKKTHEKIKKNNFGDY